MRLTQRIAVVTVGVCTAVALVTTALDPSPSVFDGPLHDVSVLARSALTDASPAAVARIAVVAVDERSLAAEELAGLPRALFSPVWAELIEAAAAAQAKVVALDFLLSFDGNAFKEGYDVPLLRALYQNRERVVLGRSSATLPPQRIYGALGFDERAVGLLELIPDSDGVFRTVQANYATVDGERLPGLAANALARAGLAMPAEVRLAPRHNLEAIPTYALIDVLRCARTDPARVAEALGGRIVFVGSVLPEEDRKFASDRLFPPLPPRTGADGVAGCSLRPLGASLPGSRTRPGVFIHAAAAQAVLAGEVVRIVGSGWRIALPAVAAAAGAAAGLILTPWTALLAGVALALGLWSLQVAALTRLAWLPTANAILALAVSIVVAYVARYLLEERRRRRVQSAFGKFLAPALVDKLTHEQIDLRLGGEDADITVMFADLSGFTRLSTRVPASELVETTNRYLALIAEEVDRTDGYVDKFIGDAVMGFWGAPVADPHHAEKAVVCAMRVVELVAAEAEKDRRNGHAGYGVKVGMFSGPAIVGNVGSERRFNYTAVGETVNVASRLESLPSIYDCPILIGDATAERVRADILLREVDTVAVKGREKPLTLYQPIAHDFAATDRQRQDVATYERGLALFRARKFAEAKAVWETLPDDPVARHMADRAQGFLEEPPPRDWDGVNRLLTKSG